MLDFLQKNRRRISVIFLIVFFLILLITQAEKSRSDNWFSAIVQNIAYPFQSAFHFAETPTNVLTSCELDPVAKTPSTKVCAVRIEGL